MGAEGRLKRGKENLEAGKFLNNSETLEYMETLKVKKVEKVESPKEMKGLKELKNASK